MQTRGTFGIVALTIFAFALASCVDLTAPKEDAPAVAAVEVDPASTELHLIDDPTVQLSAVVKDGDGNTLTDREVAWASSDEAVATVDAGGLVTALDMGDVTITASCEGQTADALVAVMPAQVHTVVVEPATFELVVGGDPSSQELTVTLLDANGDVLSGRTVTFSALPEGVVTVTDGVVTAVAEGTATITATSEGVDGTAEVTVLPRVIDPDEYESNDSPGQSYVLGAVNQDEPFAIQANFHDSAVDQNDWYWVTPTETNFDCTEGAESFTFTVDLTGIPEGSNYQLEMYTRSGSGAATSPSDYSWLAGNADETVSLALNGTCGVKDTWELLVRVFWSAGPPENLGVPYTLSMSLTQP